MMQHVITVPVLPTPAEQWTIGLEDLLFILSSYSLSTNVSIISRSLKLGTPWSGHPAY